MDENEISKVIVDAAIEVHKELGGPGLLETVYEEALTYLRLLDLRLAIVINFGRQRVSEGIRRVVNRLEESDANVD